MTNTPAGAVNNATASNDGNDRPADGGGDNSVRAVVGRAVGGSAGANAVVHRLHEETVLAREIIAQTKSLVGDDDDIIETAIEGETDLAAAVDAALKRMAELEALIESAASLSRTLSRRIERFSRQHETLREMLAVALETTGQQRFELAIGTAALKRVPPNVIVTAEADIPPRFWKPQEPKLNRKELAKALKDGETVPGAQLSNGSQTVQVTFS